MSKTSKLFRRVVPGNYTLMYDQVFNLTTGKILSVQMIILTALTT